MTKLPHKINDRSFISLSDKYWYWRLAPNHKSFLFADCGENEDVLLDDLTNKCMYLIRYKVMVSNPITTSKHVYCHLSIMYYILLVQWIPLICKAYLPEKMFQLSRLCDKTKRYSDRKYRLQVPWHWHFVYLELILLICW